MDNKNILNIKGKKINIASKKSEFSTEKMFTELLIKSHVDYVEKQKKKF